MSQPLFVTAENALMEELLRLAAAAGVTPDVARDPATALRGWTAAPLVLLGADLAEELARLGPARRAGVHVVSWGSTADDLFRHALAVGAENVGQLPGSDSWVVEILTDLGDVNPHDAPIIGVFGGSGGAGATTFACALGQVAARSGPALVVDLDPLGPGIDRMLGLDHAPGVRWDALCATTGRLGSRSLREALPRRGGLGALTWKAGEPCGLAPFAVRNTLAAARRAHDLVVVDLPRSREPLVEEVVSRCDVVVIVAAPTVAGVASASRLAARYADRTGVRLVLRGTGIDPRQVARVTGVQVAVSMTDQRGLDESIDLGLGPVRSHRSQLGRAAHQVLQRVSVTVVAA